MQALLEEMDGDEFGFVLQILVEGKQALTNNTNYDTLSRSEQISIEAQTNSKVIQHQHNIIFKMNIVWMLG